MVVLMLGFVTTGATSLTCRTMAGQDDKKTPEEKPMELAGRKDKRADAGKVPEPIVKGLGKRTVAILSGATKVETFWLESQALPKAKDQTRERFIPFSLYIP